MLSKRSVKDFGGALQWFYAIKISTLRWNQKYDCINVTDSKLQLLAVVLNVGLYLLYGINVTWSMVHR